MPILSKAVLSVNGLHAVPYMVVMMAVCYSE